MTPNLLAFWTGMLTHLWQTTLVLIPLFFLDRLMPRAPGAVRNSLWTLALTKFLLPFSLVSRPIQTLFGFLLHGRGASGAASELPTVAVISAVVDPARGFGLKDRVAGMLPAWIPIGLSIMWGGVALFLVGKLMWEVCAACRQRGVPLSALREDERVYIESLLVRARVPFSAIKLTADEVVPSVVGLVRPCIVMPAFLLRAMEAKDLHAILLHEHAHGIRRDPFRAVIQRLCLAMFFFYPPIWLVLRRLQETAEFACDESAVQGGVAPADYGRALSRVCSLALEPMVRWAAAVEGDGSLLHRRLSNLRSPSLGRHRPAHRVIVVCGALVVAAGLIVPLPTLAVPGERDSVPLPPRVVLDRVPELISYANPVYPESAREAGVEGRVYLNLRINEEGIVDSAYVARGVDGHPELAEAALATARRWVFKPGEQNGKPVMAWVAVPVAFSLTPSNEVEANRAPPALHERISAAPQPPAPASTHTGEMTDEVDLPILDTMPELIEQRSPIYPARARTEHAEGTVILSLHVSARGIVDSVCVSQDVDDYPEFAEAALAAAHGWRFIPGTRDGTPVAAWVRCPVRFRLDSSEVKSSSPTTFPEGA